MGCAGSKAEGTREKMVKKPKNKWLRMVRIYTRDVPSGEEGANKAVTEFMGKEPGYIDANAMYLALIPDHQNKFKKIIGNDLADAFEIGCEEVNT